MKQIKIMINRLFTRRKKFTKHVKSEVNNKLYVLVSNDLAPVYGAVQGGHAVAQFLIDHPHSKWQNNTVVYLSCNIDEMLHKITRIKDCKKYIDCKEYSFFYEPDLNNKLTAIAAYEIPQNYVKHLHLLR